MIQIQGAGVLKTPVGQMVYPLVISTSHYPTSFAINTNRLFLGSFHRTNTNRVGHNNKPDHNFFRVINYDDYGRIPKLEKPKTLLYAKKLRNHLYP